MTVTDKTVSKELEVSASEELASLKAQKNTKRPPAKISGSAHKALAEQWRQWSGWKDGRLEFTKPTENEQTKSEIAVTNKATHVAQINADMLVRNPNRVLNMVTPFRLKQEGVLTGVLLHEAAHARYSNWMPATEEEAEGWTGHSDGTMPTKKTVEFARLLEEARIEGRMSVDAKKNGAAGLIWTMRAAAADLLPMTKVSDNEAQAVMDIIGSWVKRAGRMKAVKEDAPWVGKFDMFLETAVYDWLEAEFARARQEDPNCPDWDVDSDTVKVLQYLYYMVMCSDDDGSTMLDYSRSVLEILFRNQDEDEIPDPDQGIHGEAGGSGTGMLDADDPDQKMLASLEEAANGEAQQETTQQTDPGNQPLEDQKNGPLGGRGAPNRQRGWRGPTPQERALQKDAERFLRTLIAPTESTKVTITDSPSATVDPVAYSAWKASGMVRAPHFFKRTQRTTEAAPPVKIALLVDVSGSMSILQKPSAVLAWALSAAAMDLANFAGRGQQIEVTMIHWGDSARVVQKVGEMPPGIHTVPCNEGTTALHLAIAKIEEQIPDFFKPNARSNRLIVNFTDWQLAYYGGENGVGMAGKALATGVNMVSVMPHGNKADLNKVEAAARMSMGKSTSVIYNDRAPSQVWDEAAKQLKEMKG